MCPFVGHILFHLLVLLFPLIGKNASAKQKEPFR